ncbi:MULTISPECIES: cytochrome b [unclassified Sphingobium]|uniref:cytochrome b n=1 Tax=unclassified Sphingobium TaxID=2611147 RepID=UPI002225688D|nr:MULTISPECIES: cytochrome b/b6 domain-containing protein [unclassified Sphingobium]MCW2395753.1 cytochrome b561 [Sphingobium sp. B8D3B]MCW2419268.1 cytochrome b561 [Sphingobium sp. B8D3C]
MNIITTEDLPSAEFGRPERYSLTMRILHWVRAALIIGLLALGVAMTNMKDGVVLGFDGYHYHKEFGILVLLLALVHLIVRARTKIPPLPRGLAPWEAIMAKMVKRAIMVLVIVVPVMGYCMSSSFTMSDGVPFFFFGELPEILPKNDKAFELFGWLHMVLAYALLGLVALHISGTLKHRFLDKDKDEIDVLSRML